MKRYIHVDTHAVKQKRACPIVVKTYNSNVRASAVEILDAAGEVVARMVYRPNDPLHCGARVWIETQHEVRIEA